MGAVQPTAGPGASAEQRPAAHRVVALVGSAGAIEATRTVLSQLPPSFPASVIVLIHTAPLHPSHLVDLLSRHCALPVEVASPGAELAQGRVIVVPSGRHLLITARSTCCLIDSGDYPPNRPSADLLLATLATTQGERTVAVILSGHGNDGATGATAVHVCGGTVLATDERSSASFSMPLAAISRANVVDQVLPLERVAVALQDVVGPLPAAG